MYHNTEEIRSRILTARQVTKDILGDYFQKTLEQRDIKTGCGSVFHYTGLEHMLFCDLIGEWQEYTNCPNLMEGCTAFKLQYAPNGKALGQIGIIPLSQLSDDDLVVLDDRKGTGKVSATIKGVRGQDVDFAVMILGPEQGKEVIYTIHPGDPVNPSQVDCEIGMHGKTVTVKEAKELGLETVKII
jgi:hypothetical protein